MPNVNQIVPFSTGEGANVLDPTTYAALPAVQTGYQAGVAQSAQLNTTWRQSSVVASMIAQFIVDVGNVSVLDDGNVATLEANFEAALRALITTSTPVVHRGDDTSGSATAIVATLYPAPGSYATDDLFVVAANNACPGGSITANFNSLGTKPVVRNDGSALVSADWAQHDRLVLIYDGTSMRVHGLVPSQIAAAVSSSTTISSTVQSEINISTARGMTPLKAFTASIVVSDIAVNPSFTTLLTSGNFSGASFAQVGGSCALRQTDDSGALIGFTVRFRLTDVTASTTTDGAYLGGGASLTGTAQIQLPFSTPLEIFQGLNPAHTYNLSIIAQKGTTSGPIQGYDPRILAYHDGTNS